MTDSNLQDELKRRNVLQRLNNDTYGFLTTDKKIDREKILNRLNGVTDETIRKQLLNQFKGKVPGMTVIHEGAH